MALLWCDGFDHYGTTPSGGRAAMLAGPWAELSDRVSVSAAQARIGANSLRFDEGTITAASQPLARRLLGENKVTVGFGFGIYMPAIFAVNNRDGFQLRDDANGAVLTFALQSDASIEVFRGTATGTSIGRTGQVLTAEAWNHVEVRAHRDASAGELEIRVNGVSVLDLTGANTGANDFASLMFGGFALSTATHFEYFVDDLFTWDTAGSSNNDFIGSLGVYTLFPDQDTAQADWAVTGAATGAEALDEVPPDDDTSYITAATAGDVSEFDLDDLPAGVSEIAALVMVGRMRKTNAGSGNVQMGLVSSDAGSPPAPAVANGADRPITEIYTYWQDVIANDPATGAPWSVAAANGAKLRMDRTV